MNVVVGLGNPGKEYQKTRHNAGFLVVESVATALEASWQEKPKFQSMLAKQGELVLAKPLTFMNNSGQAVRSIVDFYGDSIQTNGLWVVFDDLDLEVGKIKIQFAKGPKVHNGLSSLYQHLKTDQFWHVRIGVDGREGRRVIPPDKYVLSSFSLAEQQKIDAAIGQVSQNLIELSHATV